VSRVSVTGKTLIAATNAKARDSIYGVAPGPGSYVPRLRAPRAADDGAEDRS
jgi:hypothetical protein